MRYSVNSPFSPYWHRLARVAAFLAVVALLAVASVTPTLADDDDDDENRGVRDTFRGDSPSTPLPSHTPNRDSVGDGWFQSPGANFQIAADGRSVRDAGLNFTPRVATIDTLVSEYDLEVRIKRTGPSTLTGVVFRYVDAENHMAVTHDGRRLRLVKVVNGVETVLRRSTFRSRSDDGDLWRIEVSDESVVVRIDGRRKMRTTDVPFTGATVAGLIQQPSQDTRFKNFIVKPEEDDDDDDDRDDDDRSTPNPSAPVVLDSFSAPDGTPIESHTGTEVASGGGWSEIAGIWHISGGVLTLESPNPARPSGDHIVVIPSEDAPLQEISADVTWHGGLAGLAWNVSDASAYSLLFWDGATLVVGRVEGGAFLERGRREVTWAPGQTRNLRIRLQDGHAFVYVDDSEPIMLAFGIENPSILNAGVFDRFNAGNSFDNFTVRTSPASQDLPVLVPDPPIGPPDPATPPDDAWLYDSFNSSAFSLLRFRTPEIDPSGGGWTDDDSFWMILDQQASEQSGVFGPDGFDRFAAIDTGTDSYQLRSNVEWDGGRAGVFFGGRGTGNDDAGRNGFIFFRSGDVLHVGQLIGGVYFPIDSTDKFNWVAGRTKTLRVDVEGDRATLRLNGKRIFRFRNSALQDSTWAGLFQRGGQDERYEDFTIRLP